MTYSMGGAAVTPGTGPALYFAREGFAGLEVDGPLGGLRNTTKRVGSAKPIGWSSGTREFLGPNACHEPLGS
jgi:hypothetical protein